MLSRLHALELVLFATGQLGGSASIFDSAKRRVSTQMMTHVDLHYMIICNAISH